MFSIISQNSFMITFPKQELVECLANNLPCSLKLCPNEKSCVFLILLSILWPSVPFPPPSRESAIFLCTVLHTCLYVCIVSSETVTDLIDLTIYTAKLHTYLKEIQRKSYRLFWPVEVLVNPHLQLLHGLNHLGRETEPGYVFCLKTCHNITISSQSFN